MANKHQKQLRKGHRIAQKNAYTEKHKEPRTSGRARQKIKESVPTNYGASQTNHCGKSDQRPKGNDW